MKRTSLTIVKATALVGVVMAAVLTAKAPAAPPVCPKIYAPVICDDGKVYANQCLADRKNAQNCVPYGL